VDVAREPRATPALHVLHEPADLWQAPLTWTTGRKTLLDMDSATYLGKCKTKGCKHATRVAGTDVQDLDSHRRNDDAVLVTPTGATYDPALPFILNGVGVTARCPEHGVYRLSYLKGRMAPDHKCDARCTQATGPNCDCSSRA
jgi:hypothetical protein